MRETPVGLILSQNLLVNEYAAFSDFHIKPLNVSFAVAGQFIFHCQLLFFAAARAV